MEFRPPEHVPYVGEASSEPPIIGTHAAFQNLPRPAGKSLCARSQPPHDALWSIVGRVGPSQAATQVRFLQPHHHPPRGPPANSWLPKVLA